MTNGALFVEERKQKILEHIEARRKATVAELCELFHVSSATIRNDLRDLETEAAKGCERAVQALEVYAYRVRKYIGAYAANLVKVDALVFTGGIGQHGVKMRERICHRLENLGIFMDYELNTSQGSGEGLVSAPFSPIAILVVPTNEELQIAIDTYDLIFGAQETYRLRRTDVTL